MEAALYDREEGFYTRGPRIGRGGAFATVPTLVPLFARALAVDLRARWESLGRPAPFTVCEVGPGDGTLAAALAEQLADLPLELVLCERAEGLAAQQRDRLPGARHVLLDDLEPVSGAIIANEVHDACPAHALRWPDELLVAVDGDGHFVWSEAESTPGALRAIVERSGANPAAGVELQVAPAQTELQTTLAGLLVRGGLYVFDYGESGPERYLRKVPRLRTYIGGRPGGDPLSGPGTQDITVDVDFGALRAAGEDAGLRTVLDEPQPAWLRRHGALGLAETLPPTSEERLWLETLTRSDGAGASFRVLVQERAERGSKGCRPVRGCKAMREFGTRTSSIRRSVIEESAPTK
jgi:NADH dehydrogenase [ubiquinone] 1 alpha subcomplex assembly factor 7